MAAGTIVSRFSGYLRSLLLAAALGNLLHADLFTIGNTVPNMLYILLAGGIFNAVLVPQLVRAMRSDPDGGEAYTNRIVTLSALFLGAVTVVLVVGRAVGDGHLPVPRLRPPELAAQRDSIIAFARYCLPQVFFYGMFALVGQVLNARRRFGPMMWAPIANNLVSIAVLVGYLVYYGPVADDALCSAYTPAQEAWLGLGATARHRRPAAGAAAVPAGGRLPLPAALRLPRHRPRPHPAARRSGPCCSWSSTRSRTPSWSAGLGRHRAGARQLRQRRRRGRGDRLHGLRADLPDRDGAARGGHRLAGHRDAAAAVRRRAARGDLPGARRQPGAGAAHRARRSSCRSRCCCPSWRPTWPRSCGTGAPPAAPTPSTSCRCRCSASASCSSPSTTWCCAASTPSSAPAPCSSSSARWRPPTSWWRSSWSRAPTPSTPRPRWSLAYTASYVVGLGGVVPRAAPQPGQGGGGLATPTLVRFLVRLAGRDRRRRRSPRGGWRLLLPGRDDPSHLLALLRLVAGRRRRRAGVPGPGPADAAHRGQRGHRHGHPAVATALQRRR